MHPDPRFRSDLDPLDVAHRIGFAHIFVAAPEPMVVHAPVTRHGDTLRFHVARANRAIPHLDGATILVSVAGPDGYISPNWYPDRTDQVPTWDYVAVEIDGRCAAVGEAELVEQLDALAAAHEPRVNPADPWTRAKMDPGRFGAMLRGIRGFAVTPTATRATVKLNQHKSAGNRLGTAAGLRAAGFGALADAVDAGTWPPHA